MDSKIDAYIDKQDSPQKEICQELRKVIHEALPDAKEKMKWGVPSFDNGNFYIVALKYHVNIGFSIKSLTTEEVSALQGTGKTMRHLEIHSLEQIDQSKITRLIRLVKSKS